MHLLGTDGSLKSQTHKYKKIHSKSDEVQEWKRNVK